MDQQSPGAGEGSATPPTGRVPQWVVDETARLGTTPTQWQSWAPMPPPPPVVPLPPLPPAVRPRNWRVAIGVVLALVLSLGTATLVDPERLSLADSGPEYSFPPAPGTPKADKGEDHQDEDSSSTGGHVDGFPSPLRPRADTPLGTPLPPPAEGGTHEFLEYQEDGAEPVAYDPCRPIHYVMRPDNAPRGGEEMLHEAVTHISQLTGLQFVYDGVTGEGPNPDREPFQPDVYGDRWAPVRVAWETEEENPDFSGEIVGEAGSQWAQFGASPKVYVTGDVSLDEDEFDYLLTQGRQGREVARAIILHELGHLVGLDHVDDDDQLMYPRAGDVFDFAPGDLTGLSVLGAGACVPGL